MVKLKATQSHKVSYKEQIGFWTLVHKLGMQNLQVISNEINN